MEAFRRLPLRVLLTRLAFAGIAVVVLGGMAWATRTHSVRQLIPLPSAEAIGPGVGIKVTGAGRTTATGCTAGFLVLTKDDQPGLLSAGYCDKPTEPGRVAVHHGGLYPTVGTFVESVYEGNGWTDSDIGLIILKDPDKIPLKAEVDGYPVTGLTERVEIGDTLCHLGIRSGEPMCGPVTAVEKNKVRFAAATTCGDAGGPAYLMRPGDTVEAVGILTAVSDDADPETVCDGPREYSVAELLKPWLEAWQLTLVTTTAQ